MGMFEHAGQTIHYEESGSGEPILLMTGWGGSIEEFTGLRKALEPSYRVIAADVPGSGMSGPQPREYTPSYLRDDAALFLAMLDALGAAPAHLIGFSDGGEYALLMAALQPCSVRTLVSWGAVGQLGDVPEMADAFAIVIDDPIPPLQDFSEYMKATYGESNARLMTQSLGRTLRTMMEAGGDISRSLAGDISCPALLIAGEHDFLATPALVSEMARAIPRGDFIEVKDASHPIHLEKPDWLVATITGWLSNH